MTATMKIPFNKPHFTGREAQYITQMAVTGRLSGNGMFTRKCHEIFETRLGFGKVLLTTSCTDALEMAALLADIRPGDEVIMPSFTFVSTANAFILRGARIVFADTAPDYPNIDVHALEGLITPLTRAIAVVHYAGVACDMEVIMALAKKYNLLVIEDAAHSLDSFYKGKPLGGIGHFGTFSFHETKNIIAGEGGLLALNDPAYVARGEILWEKGTDRVAFSRGDVAKYEWQDVGSSFLPSEITAAFLLAQLEDMKHIQDIRKDLWNRYYERLKPLADQGFFTIPAIPGFATHNGSLFFILARDPGERRKLLKHLNNDGIQAVFHYLPLHSSPYYKTRHDGRILKNTDRFAGLIIRLPFYASLNGDEMDYVVKSITRFYLKGK